MSDDTGIRFRPFPCCVCGEYVRIGAQSPEAAATVRWSDVVRVYCHDCWPYHSDKPKRQPPVVSRPAEGDDSPPSEHDQLRATVLRIRQLEEAMRVASVEIPKWSPSASGDE